MNERIKALAVEADFMLCEDDHFYSEGQSQKITKQLQKFAELIVQECAGVGYDASYYECALNVSNKIKEHFGVEE
jgi:hypothetical protein